MQKSKKKFDRKRRRGGFSLIEIMVAIGLFSVVMLLSVAVIFSIVEVNRRSQEINGVVNNLNFSIESIIRDIKTGYWYQCHDYYRNGDWPSLAEFETFYLNQRSYPSSDYSCDNAGQPIEYITLISTLSGEKRVIEYYFEEATPTHPGRIKKVYKKADGEFVDSTLTTPDIDIQNVDFYVNNAPPSPLAASEAKQPSVFVTIKGVTNVAGKEPTTFGIQTFISQRLFNI